MENTKSKSLLYKDKFYSLKKKKFRFRGYTSLRIGKNSLEVGS